MSENKRSFYFFLKDRKKKINKIKTTNRRHAASCLLGNGLMQDYTFRFSYMEAGAKSIYLLSPAYPRGEKKKKNNKTQVNSRKRSEEVRAKKKTTKINKSAAKECAEKLACVTCSKIFKLMSKNQDSCVSDHASG